MKALVMKVARKTVAGEQELCAEVNTEMVAGEGECGRGCEKLSGRGCLEIHPLSRALMIAASLSRSPRLVPGEAV